MIETDASQPSTPQTLQELIAGFNSRLDTLNANLDVRELESRRSRTLTRWLSVVLVFVLALTVVIGIGLIVLINTSGNQSDQASVISKLSTDNTDRINCISDWANATSVRTQIVTNLNATRTDSIDNLVLALAVPHPGVSQQSVVSKAFADYLKAEKSYKDGLKANPIPPAPAFNCK